MKKALVPLSVLIVTKSPKIEQLVRCINSLEGLDDDIHVIESDNSALNAQLADVIVPYSFAHYKWNGQYPKKRQYCLDNIDFKHDWILMIDADEYMTSELLFESISWFKSGMHNTACGVFIKGAYKLNGEILKYGIQNNKLCLFNRHKMTFPEVDDLSVKAMGEIEGHYQPVPKIQDCGKMHQFKGRVVHDAFLGQDQWSERHEKYAQWEAFMILNKKYPQDPVRFRQVLKVLFRSIPCRAELSFLYSFILKLGFLDGVSGYYLARSRYLYYKSVKKYQKINKQYVS